MRYIILTFPVLSKTLLSTDFRFIAFIVAAFLCLRYLEVAVIDTETDETFFLKNPRRALRRRLGTCPPEADSKKAAC